MKTVRVLLIGFYPIVREGLKAILAVDYEIEPVLEAADADQALLQLKQASDEGRPIHVVLTEARTSTLDGIHTTRLIKQAYPEIPVLVLTKCINDSNLIDAIHAGAAGYFFLDDMSPKVLLLSMDCMIERHTDECYSVARCCRESEPKMAERSLHS